MGKRKRGQKGVRMKNTYFLANNSLFDEKRWTCL